MWKIGIGSCTHRTYPNFTNFSLTIFPKPSVTATSNDHKMPVQSLESYLFERKLVNTSTIEILQNATIGIDVEHYLSRKVETPVILLYIRLLIEKR